MFMEPLKNYYSEAVTVCLQRNGHPLTPNHVMEPLRTAYIPVQTVETAINQFKAT